MTSIVSRQFILVFSEIAGANLAYAQVYKAMLDQSRITYTEFIALADWMTHEVTANEEENFKDPERADIGKRWSACADRCGCDIEETTDTEWHAIDAELDAWFERKQTQSLADMGFPDLADMRRNHTRAYKVLAMAGANSLQSDPDVIPCSVVGDYAELTTFTFQVRKAA